MVIDEGFPVLEWLGDEVEGLEDELLDSPSKTSLRRLHQLKRTVAILRRMLWPQRDVLNSLVRGDSGLIADENMVYYRDCYDHTIQIMDLIETYRDMATGMLDVYLSSISYRLNEIMRVLTMIATIFIPLTFVVGVYGMNFGNAQQSVGHAGTALVLWLPAGVAGDDRDDRRYAGLFQAQKVVMKSGPNPSETLSC